MKIKQFFEIKIRHQVPTDDDEVLIAYVLLRQFNSPCCTIIIIRNHIGDLDTKITPILKIILDDIWLEIQKNDKFGDAKIFEHHHCMFHHRFIDDRQHWFWSGVCQRLNPCAKSTCHNNCFHGITLLSNTLIFSVICLLAFL